MFLKAYSFLDTKTGLHSSPFFVVHDEIAIRSAVGVGLDPTTHIGQYPSDFVLLHVGEFDDNAGQLFHCAPRNLGVVSALLASSARVVEQV